MNIYGSMRAVFSLIILVFCPFVGNIFAYQPQERVFDKLLQLASKQAAGQNKKILVVQQPRIVQIPAAQQEQEKSARQGPVEDGQERE